MRFYYFLVLFLFFFLANSMKIKSSAKTMRKEINFVCESTLGP